MREGRVQRPRRHQLPRPLAQRLQVGGRIQRLQDDRPHLAHVVLVQAAHGCGRGADADAGRDRGRALVVGNGVAVDRDRDLVQALLGVLARPLRGAQVELQQVVVGAVGEQPQAAVHQGLGQRRRVRDHLPLVVAEALALGDLEADGLGRDDVAERAALQTGEHRPVDGLGVLGARQHQAGARPGQRLVRGRRDHVGVLHRVRVQAGRDQPGEVRHVHHHHGAHLVGDLTEAGRVDDARVGGGAGHDQLRPHLVRKPPNLVEVDQRVLAADAVWVHVVEAAREVDLEPVGEVTAVVEAQAQDRVAGLDQGEVGGHVGRPAGVRLDVGVVGAEQLLGAVDGKLLDLVHPLAAAVVAVPRVALGVLVGQHRADRLQHRRPGEVLRRDQLQLIALAAQLAVDQRRDGGIGLGQPGRLELPQGVLGRGHRHHPLLRRIGSRRCYSMGPASGSAGSGSTGRPAAAQASKPPTMSVARSNPSRCRVAAARLEE